MTAELTLKLDYHAGRGITVDATEGDVNLAIHAEDSETVNEAHRSLAVDEARALAAMLTHFANEAER